jgi:hypothetical protein
MGPNTIENPDLDAVRKAPEGCDHKNGRPGARSPMAGAALDELIGNRVRTGDVSTEMNTNRNMVAAATNTATTQTTGWVLRKVVMNPATTPIPAEPALDLNRIGRVA